MGLMFLQTAIHVKDKHLLQESLLAFVLEKLAKLRI